MKRVELVILGLFLWFVCAAQIDDMDRYVPKEYIPLEYHPESSLLHMNRRVKQFRPIDTVPIDSNGLKQFVHLSNENNEIKEQYKLEFSKYIDIAAKAQARGKEPSWKKKEKKAYQQDYRLLEYRLYQKDSMKIVHDRQCFIQDSLAKRNTFITDSLKRRRRFVEDSLKKREVFVKDSLYRAQFCIKNHYDRVVWSAPHGEPLMCYRKGKLIEGKTYNDKGQILKEWKNGRLIHNYEYSEEWSWGSGCRIVEDKTERTKTEYKLKNSDDTVGEFYRKEWYDSSERVVKTLNNEGQYTKITYYPNGEEKTKIKYDIKGKVLRRRENTYSPDGKSVVTEFNYEESVPDQEVTEYFSDGKWAKTSRYKSYDNGRTFVLRKVREYDGPNSTKVYHYDRNGKFERGEIIYDPVKSLESLFYLW